MPGLPTAEEWRQALIARHGEARQQRLAAATVAVCGLGGLGSNIALALARAGVGRLLLLDYDRVELSNLHRQQYKAAQIGCYKTEALRQNLLEIAPYLQVLTHTVRLGPENLPELLAEAQVVCEALDQAEAKAMLCDVVLSQLPDKYLVADNGTFLYLRGRLQRCGGRFAQRGAGDGLRGASGPGSFANSDRSASVIRLDI